MGVAATERVAATAIRGLCKRLPMLFFEPAEATRDYAYAEMSLWSSCGRISVDFSILLVVNSVGYINITRFWSHG